MVNDLQVDRWMDAVRAELADFEAASPGGIEHALIFDQSTYVTERFAALGANLAAGIGLVTLVLFVTLGWRAALVVASAIPLAALISLFGMNLAGISIHQMSVTGLIVALGLLVDAAIVMTDEIRKRLADGAPRLDAVRRAVRMLAVPLLASTLTTVLAFMPMALLPGPVGDFVGSIAKSVIIMLVASLALALTLTPALAGWLLPAGGDRPQRWWRDGMVLPRLGRAFDHSLALSLRHPGLAILASLALPVTGFLAFPTLTAQFFPGADRNQFYVQLTLCRHRFDHPDRSRRRARRSPAARHARDRNRRLDGGRECALLLLQHADGPGRRPGLRRGAGHHRQRRPYPGGHSRPAGPADERVA